MVPPTGERTTHLPGRQRRWLTLDASTRVCLSLAPRQVFPDRRGANGDATRWRDGGGGRTRRFASEGLPTAGSTELPGPRRRDLGRAHLGPGRGNPVEQLGPPTIGRAATSQEAADHRQPLSV